MKTRHLAPLAAAILITACDKQSPETAKQISELERQANEAVARQRELEQQLAERQLAAERDAIERERMRIEEDRIEMERQQGEAAAAEAERIRQRETELATREGKLMRLESDLDEKRDEIDLRGEELGERERQLAGREAIPSANDNPEPASETVGDFRVFHESLSPYGSWFETPDYGYVWQPVIVRDSGWRPYTRGRWVCTDRGWTWVSDEPFGWACYHYGRWALCRNTGWVWVPGSEWAPAWVTWRSGGSHIGWAPLPPETLAWRGHRWDSSVEITFGIGSSWFNFVETRNFCEPVHHYCLPYTQNGLYIGQTVNITNIHIHNRRVICGGPRYSDVAVQTKRRPPFYRIEEDRHDRRGRDLVAMRPRIDGNRLKVAAPNLNADWNDAIRPDKIKGRIDQFQIDRKEPVPPEITNRFRQSREESRIKAEESIARHGGRETLRKNRTLRQIAPRTDQHQAGAGVPGNTTPPRGVAPRDDMGKPGTDPQVVERLRESGMRPALPPTGQNPPPSRPPSTGGDRQASNTTTNGNNRGSGVSNRPRTVAPRDDMRRPGTDPAVTERLRESGMRPSPPPATGGNRNPSGQTSRQDNRANEARGQQQERARQQQQQVQRQREQQERTRQQQEQAQRQREQQERARQQQEQAQRQREQQERSRQQQEQAQRQREQQERARQQQQQVQRQREQQERSRQQQEQAQRQREQQERARQQQQQVQRQREQQERTRQQQEQAQRQREQQERARQQQEQAQRQREQQERARQQQEERSRQQQRDEEQRRGRNR